jgi:intein/homing endonuclease
MTGSVPPDDPNLLAYCVPAGQVVDTPNGRVPIQDVRVGDKVLSMNPETKLLEYKPIVNRLVHNREGSRRLLKLKHGSGFMIVTDDHPVWSEDRQKYVQAGSLRPGERILVESNSF